MKFFENPVPVLNGSRWNRKNITSINDKKNVGTGKWNWNRNRLFPVPNQFSGSDWTNEVRHLSVHWGVGVV